MARLLSFLACLVAAFELRAQTPSSTASPAKDALINSMSAADLQQAVQLLKSSYIKPDAFDEIELNRAMLGGLLTRLNGGAMLIAQPAPDNPQGNQPFRGELLEGHIGYLRPGALTTANLQAMDASLQSFAGKKMDAIVLDLRASGATNDFPIAAEFAKRFCPKGKPLFTLQKTTPKQERTFASDRDPAFQGVMIVLADGDTAGPAEAIAGTLRLYDKALLIGQPTAGRAVEFADLPLNGGKVLRVAVAEAVLPENRALFPEGLKPDVPVEMPAAEKRLIFEKSLDGGMAPFVFESERPHLNEAALLAGKNPEIEALETAQRRARQAEKPQPRDAVLQRAIDVITSLSIYQGR